MILCCSPWRPPPTFQNPRNLGPLPPRQSFIVSSSHTPRRKTPKNAPQINNNNGSVGGDDKEEEERRRRRSERAREGHVHCEVDVVSWRERRIRAVTEVRTDVESVWGVLTDYERLADFIPNLVFSGRIECPHEGRIWLEQRGLQRALYWHIEARVVLDLQEFPYSANGCELHFSMVDGDFKKYEGKWSVKAGSRSSTTILSYEVNVIPQFNFPAIFIERIISSDLPVNLRAIACRAEGNYEETQKASTIVSVSEIDSYASPIPCTLPVSPYNGINSRWGIIGKTCRLDRPCMVDEVHLRKFDGLLENGGARRCVIASITVKAPLREVWKVLTAYEALPEFVPNLAISKILLRANNKVRILQEGCKGLLYMVLHARVVLDLHEKLEQEIRFEQVEGDFESFRGRWVFEQLGNHHTLLKYVVESRIRKDTFLSEAILEEVIYEDLPSNLCAIRDFVEERESLYSKQSVGDDTQPINTETGVEKRSLAQEASCLHAPNPSRQRSKVPGLQRDIEVLKTELLTFISKYGQEGFMPMRKQLRLHGRVDIEKAITRMGGFRKIATLMNLSLAYKHRKPKGYWDNLENLQEEIERFQRSWGVDPTYMPSRKSFERAGRYDIARALEKWGGLHEVARLLSLELRHPTRQASPSREHKNENSASSSSGESSLQDQDKTHNKPIVSQDAQKWLMKLKDLDINWVE